MTTTEDRTYSLFERLDGLPSSVQRCRLSLINSHLQLLHLSLQRSAQLLDLPGVVLLLAQLFCQSRRVRHRLLGLILRLTQLVYSLLEVALDARTYPQQATSVPS